MFATCYNKTVLFKTIFLKPFASNKFSFNLMIFPKKMKKKLKLWENIL